MAASPTLRDQALALGVATPVEIDEMAAAWRGWAAADDAWFAVLHGEVLASG